MATPQGDSYGCISGGTVAAGRYRVSQFWRDLPSGWSEIATTGTQPGLGMMAYSGMALDPDGGAIYLIGGGHNDSNYSGVMKLDLESRTFSEDFPSYFPTNSPSLSDAQAVTDNTNFPGAIVVGGVPRQPISRHTHQSVRWVKQLGSVVVAGSSTFSGSGDYLWHENGGAWLNDPKDFWTYNPISKSFSYKGSALTNLANFYATRSVVSPIDGKLYCFRSDSNSHLYCSKVDPRTGATEVLAGLDVGDITQTASSCFDKTGRFIYLLCAKGSSLDTFRLIRYDTQTDSYATMPANGGALPNFAYDECFTIECSKRTGKLYCISNNSKSLFIYDVTTGVWSNQSISSLPLLAQVSGRFIYDARRDVFLLVYPAQYLGVKVYAFRE